MRTIENLLLPQLAASERRFSCTVNSFGMEPHSQDLEVAYLVAHE